MSFRLWFRKSAYFNELERLIKFLVPAGYRVMMVAFKDWALLESVKPEEGLGVAVRSGDPVPAGGPANCKYISVADETSFPQGAPFDYILLPDVVPTLNDVQKTLVSLQPLCSRSTRVVITFHSNLWKPMLRLATFLGLRRKEDDRNWFSVDDIDNLLTLSGYETVASGFRILLPVYIPGLSWLFNRLLAQLPGMRHLCLAGYVVARKHSCSTIEPAPSVSILIPTRNERGNIEQAFTRTPKMGAWSELVFVDGHSDDGTVEEIERCIKKYEKEWPRVRLIHQTGKGKGQAVRQALPECKGDIFMILDSDLTMPPEDLPKYYEALVDGKGELINGSRLVYSQEDQAMRFLNMIANYFFGHAFSWLLSQRIKDTLCGTKAFWRKDYENIAANREYFGDFDPFGDFDLLFGAAKLNLKLIDMPIKYRNRTYGEIKIRRWHDGMLLLRMCFIAFYRFKM